MTPPCPPLSLPCRPGTIAPRAAIVLALLLCLAGLIFLIPDRQDLFKRHLSDGNAKAASMLLDREVTVGAAGSVTAALTSEAIPDKSMGRAWDTASRVASHGAGDCTEHAVLLAALARSFEIPARVVVGTVILEHEGEWQAYRHAWTEIFDGARWQLADFIRDRIDALEV